MRCRHLVDSVDVATRSRMMSSIKGKNTKPEMAVRNFLHKSGHRFRLHRKDLPGKPDIVLPKCKLVIFVHGCFWHRHTGCFYSFSPATRKEFWQVKLEGNVSRDALHTTHLLEMGWRVMIVWECGIKHSMANLEEVLALIGGKEILVEWPILPPRLKV